MQWNGWICSAFLIVATTFGISGCGTSAKSPAPEAGHERATHDHGAHDHGDATEIAEQLAKLSPADRALAEVQKTCPVTGEPLGSMGVPLKVAVGDREVFVCCKGCEKPLKNDPEKYLEKLPQ